MKILFTLPVVFLIACGGGDVGDSCDQVGSTDECSNGTICTNRSGGAQCLVECDRNRDCPGDQECKGISKTSRKSCQGDGDLKINHYFGNDEEESIWDRYKGSTNPDLEKD